MAYMPEHRLALCKEDYVSWFLEHTGRAIKKFSMFGPKDRVLVAVSGGKDSLALWHALTRLGYQADGLYIDLGISSGGYSDQSWEACLELSERLGRKLLRVRVAEKVGASIPVVKNLTSREPCSACGLVKRYYMNRMALEEDYEVMATGHNLDDEVAVLFANTLRWEQGYLARQYPVLEEGEGFKRKVKPFIYFSEKQTTLYSLANRIAYVREECPYAAGATTLYYKGILNQLEHHSPGTKRRFLDGFLRVRELFAQAQDLRLTPCRSCGQPTSGNLCAYCRLVEQVRQKVRAAAPLGDPSSP